MILIDKIKKKGILKLFARSFLFLMILIFLDFSIGGILKNLYFKQDSGLLYRTTYSLDSTKAELLIFGSSTANHHYNPSIFEKRMKITTYNTGRDGNTIFYNYAVFLSVLKRYSPKIVILDFNVREFKVFPNHYDRLSSLLPYYKTHPELRSIIQLKGPYEKYKLLSKIYPYNSLLFTILIGNSDLNKTRDNINDDKGYVPLYQIWHNKLSNEPAISYKVDSNKINILKYFIEECKKNNIQLYISISPRFIKYIGKDLSIEIVHNIANEFNVPFYDFSRDTLFWNHNEYFTDRIHLNSNGANIFSNKVINKILQNQQSILINNNDSFSLKKAKSKFQNTHPK